VPASSAFRCLPPRRYDLQRQFWWPVRITRRAVSSFLHSSFSPIHRRASQCPPPVLLQHPRLPFSSGCRPNVKAFHSALEVKEGRPDLPLLISPALPGFAHQTRGKRGGKRNAALGLGILDEISTLTKEIFPFETFRPPGHLCLFLTGCSPQVSLHVLESNAPWTEQLVD